uniref:Protein kinase domain-containing protein n=1 Tax=Brassica oleracea var. oleracea TaxID=109376 RepID=A0A0D3D1E9_BRAOL
MSCSPVLAHSRKSQISKNRLQVAKGHQIGSGGSSEVHKVISSDCTIYALKKIKLKGRDYATAYGFCQEIGYLKKLKGKTNIIQLIDYEVTDKCLLWEVMNGTMSSKDARVKDDGC